MLMDQKILTDVINYIEEQSWQAGHTGDHRMLLLVGEYPQSPLKR